MLICGSGSIICSVDSDVKGLTLKILVVNETWAEVGSNTIVLKTTTDKEKISFWFL